MLGLNDPSKNKYRDIHGLQVDIAVDKLISRIYVAPSAPKWLVKLVTALVARYGLKKEIVHSQLAAYPLF
jgi:hypothetical protein